MSTIIDKFLAKATGPSRLRSELRLKTKPVSAFLKTLDAISTIQTQVPQSILGGDILALMSGRLRQLLQYSEQPERVTDAVAANRFRLMPQPDVSTGSEKATFAVNPMLARKSAKLFARQESPFRNQNRSLPMPNLNNRVTERDSFALLQLPKDAPLFREPETVVHHKYRPSIPEKGNITEQREQSEYPESVTGAIAANQSRLTPHPDGSTGSETVKFAWNPTVAKESENRQTVTSIFVEKLREYWKLSQREQPSEQGGNGGMAHSVPTMEKGTGENVPPFPTLLNRALASRSWPEVTGQQIAQKLHAFTSGGTNASRHVQQKLYADTPEKVEIQNVFNIEVKAENKGTDSIADLSEQIADILREQALQHGIDIT